MTDSTGSAPADWYDDPAGSGNRRWWDGTKWTEHVTGALPAQPAAPAVQVPTPGTVAAWYDDPSGSGFKRWWDGAGWTQHVVNPSDPLASAAPIPGVPDGTPVYNPFIWVIAVIAIVPTIALLFVDFSEYLANARYGALALYTSSGYLLLLALSWLVYGVIVVLSYFDWRALKKAGYIQPFHWAWSFLSSAVYVIGRSVVVTRRAGHGLATLWVWVGITVLSIVIAIAKSIAIVNQVADTIPISGYNT